MLPFGEVWLLAASIHVLVALGVLSVCVCVCYQYKSSIQIYCYVGHNLEYIIVKIYNYGPGWGIKCKINKCCIQCHVYWISFPEKSVGMVERWGCHVR